jgi:catalase
VREPTPHVNYEPSSHHGLVEAQPAGKAHTPYVAGPVVRQKISRTNDYAQAGELYRSFDDRHRDDLIDNLVTNLAQCNPDIQERMVNHLTQCDVEYGGRVASGLRIAVAEPEMVTTD